jgi:hypothetical protein
MGKLVLEKCRDMVMMDKDGNPRNYYYKAKTHKKLVDIAKQPSVMKDSKPPVKELPSNPSFIQTSNNTVANAASDFLQYVNDLKAEVKKLTHENKLQFDKIVDLEADVNNQVELKLNAIKGIARLDSQLRDCESLQNKEIKMLKALIEEKNKALDSMSSEKKTSVIKKYFFGILYSKTTKTQ